MGGDEELIKETQLTFNNSTTTHFWQTLDEITFASNEHFH